MTTPPLAGHGILITRPEHQAVELCRAVEAAGGIAMPFPLLEIIARDRTRVSTEAKALARPAIVIYVSPNAANLGIAWHEPTARTIGIGPTTVAALHRLGVPDASNPANGFDTESLLEDAALLNIKAQHVRIVRGQDGRDLLGDKLRDRGAMVDYLSVYVRRARQVSDAERRKLESQLRKGEISCLTIMSVASMDCLFEVLAEPHRDLLRQTRLVTPSRRVLKNINELFPDVRATLAPGPQADDMILGLIACLKQDKIA